jgi:hypothetical protein
MQTRGERRDGVGFCNLKQKSTGNTLASRSLPSCRAPRFTVNPETGGGGEGGGEGSLLTRRRRRRRRETLFKGLKRQANSLWGGGGDRSNHCENDLSQDAQEEEEERI